jgi:hypothetical protein
VPASPQRARGHRRRRELNNLSEPPGLLGYWRVTDNVQLRAHSGRSRLLDQETYELLSDVSGIGELLAQFCGVPAALAAGPTVGHRGSLL